MADGQVIIETKLDTSGLESGAKKATSTVNNLGKGMKTASDSSAVLDTNIQGVTRSLKTLETVAKSSVVMKLATLAIDTVKKISEVTDKVSTKLNAASTLYGDVAVDQQKLLENLYAISSQTGESVENLGQSIYDALSAGIEPTEDMADVLKIVGESAKLAKGGFTDTSTALSATISVLNAYKMDASKTNDVQNMLLQTQNKGVTTVGELGSALAKVTPTASAFGVKFEDIATSIALMTKQGTKTEIATTALAQVISELGKSGTIASKNLEKAARKAKLTDTSFKDLLSSGKSLGEILELMSNYAEANGQSMVDMFSSIEAGRATLQLVGENASSYTEILDSMHESTGLVQQSFEKTLKPTEQLASAFNNLFSNIGMQFKPLVDTLATGLASVITKMTKQETTSQDLSSALDSLKTSTNGVKKAQEDLKTATDETTTSQYKQSLASLYDSVNKVSDAYNGAQEQLKKYNKQAKNAWTTVDEAAQKSADALKEAQKINENITFEDLIKQCKEWRDGAEDLANIFPYLAENQRDIYAESVLEFDDLYKKYESSKNVAQSYSNAIAEYVNEMAQLVKEGGLSIDVLTTVNSDLAKAVEKALENTKDAVDATNNAVNNTGNNANKQMSKFKESWKNFCKYLGDNAEDLSKSLATGLGSALESFMEDVLTIKAQVAELDSQLNESFSQQEDNANALIVAEKELDDAKARGNAADIKSAEKKIEGLQKQQDAIKTTISSLQDQKKSIQDGSKAWGDFGKTALLALADVLEALGAQLAAQAVSLAFQMRWVEFGLATAGSVAAYVAAAAIKANAQKFATGGIVQGSSRQGDNVLVRANAGELVLNTAQQDNLARLIEASASLAQATGEGSGAVNIRFEGSYFYGLDEPAVGKAIYDNIQTLKYEGVI